MRGPADVAAVELGCYFDASAGQRVCDFIETFCRQSKGKGAGQAITLLAWQRDFLMRLFGWKRANGRRRYRRFYVEVAKKNGKSTLVAALVLYLILADTEGAPEIYLNACDRGQARIIFDESKRMVEASPALAKRIKSVDFKARLVCAANSGVIIANSADAPNKDGLNPSATLFDELHRQPGRELWDVFEYASAAREQPILGSITTAGEDDTGVWHEQREYSEKVNSGEIPDITHLGIVYRALETDDIDDPETWKKANPSLGDTISFEDFARELAEAKEVPIKLNNFKRLRLNIIARAAAKFFDPVRWDKLASTTPITIESFLGLETFLGLDLSSTEDLTALVLLGRTESGRYLLLCRFWCPEGNLLALEHKTKMPYRLWAEKGYLKTTDGDAIDYAFIRREIEEISFQSQLQKGLADRWNAQQLISDLIEKDGLPIEFLQQGFISLSGPTKELKRLIDAGLIVHDDNPVMRWCLGNAVATEDDQKNVKLSKAKSRQKIDGAAALVNAVAAAGAIESGESPYTAERGLIVI
jgi:phage terminase large subunit-like protein